ncbi:type II toxin-antitoxin system VapC family toxin [Rhodohalobacter sp. SW132]|uniref:type II toxin-antitoxin system VapC family toxin n=1 Tax=Rhodohalobacter sp. SW132 TaxID=2293433 RepID=UPI000E246297|nr:type II toxin-antitoxin system VapC family toxin [Rhodohalobacter sp. SW132]REL33720.1 type II toxin-antitoxin system VapC family toxin [Rhodohalobacter sp. SW132]
MSENYAKVRAGCEAKGELVGPNDLLNAATVLANNGTLATRNTKEFSLIPGIKLTEW